MKFTVTVKVVALDYTQRFQVEAATTGKARSLATLEALRSGLRLSGEHVEYDVEEIR